jgi:ankyrin repeat protein
VYGWNGRSPLSFAAANGHEEVVKLLLDKDRVNPDSAASGNYKGRTPLSFAAENGHEEVVKLLLDKDEINPDSRDSSGQTPLSFAATNWHGEVVKLLLAKNGFNPYDIEKMLFWAAMNGNLALVRMVFDSEVNLLDSRDSSGRTPLSIAAENGHEKVVELLLDKDEINPDSRDSSRRTPLSFAAGNGHKEVVELLFDKDGVNPNVKDNEGRTPLWWATEKNHAAIVRLLASRDTVTLHTFVRENKETQVRLLLDTGYRASARDSLNQTPLHVAVLLGLMELTETLISSAPDIINSADSNGMTPLRLAIGERNRRLIDLLLEKSADTKDIGADEWRVALGKPTSEELTPDIVKLSEGHRGGSVEFVRFLPKMGDPGESAGLSARSLFLIPNDHSWNPDLGPTAKLEPYKLEISSQYHDGQYDRIYVAIQFPAEPDLQGQKHAEVSYWDTSRIAWTMMTYSNPNGDRCWKSINHFSMMPYGWIPDDGLDFFKQFLLYLKERWSNLCDLAEDHLTIRVSQPRAELWLAK